MMPPEWKYASGHKSAQNMKICPETWMPGGNFGRKYAAHLSHVSLCVNGDTDEPIAHKWCFRWISVNISLSSSSSSSSSSRCLQSRYIFLAFFQLCQNDSVFDLNKCEKFKSERSKPWFGAAEDVKPSGSSRSPTYISGLLHRKDREGQNLQKWNLSFFQQPPNVYLREGFLPQFMWWHMWLWGGGWVAVFWLGYHHTVAFTGKKLATMKIEMVRYRRAQKRLIASLRRRTESLNPWGLGH